jgi:hypothetical protein
MVGVMTRLTGAGAVLVTLLAAAGGAVATDPAAASVDGTARPIVTVVRHGGHCRTGTVCRTVLRISDSRVSAAGFAPRRLRPTERASLLRAIRSLDFAAIRARPFEGTCPTAYDGQESIYRFRGFARPLASCTFDLRGVRAVILTERLLATLKPR